MLFQDPPDHTRLRGLVSKAFTPRAVEILRGEIDAIVARLLDGVRGKSTFDLMAEVAYPLPVLVICELLGVPEADRDRFGVWSAALAEALDNLTMHDPEVLARCNEAATGLTEYFRDLVRIRRSAPRDDLLSGLIAAEEQGDRLTEDELLATCVLLFFAGHETTVNLIGNGTLALLRHPRELERLRPSQRCCRTRSRSCCATTAPSSAPPARCWRRSRSAGTCCRPATASTCCSARPIAIRRNSRIRTDWT